MAAAARGAERAPADAPALRSGVGLPSGASTIQGGPNAQTVNAAQAVAAAVPPAAAAGAGPAAGATPAATAAAPPVVGASYSGPVVPISLGKPVTPESATPPVLQPGFGNLPLAFEPNLGQAGSGTDFVARGQGYGIELGSAGITLDLQKPAAAGQAGAAPAAAHISVGFAGADTTRRRQG